MNRVTIKDVANYVNVSKSTVSQFLNNRFDYMSEETKGKIAQAIKELGYQPNYIARSLKQKRTSTIGVIVANILHAFSTQVIRAIEDFYNEKDFHVIVCNADDDPEKERNYINMLQAKQVDGLIVFPTGGNMDLYQRMEEAHYPIVFVDRIIENININAVLLDNEMASSMAVEHLIEKGHDKIGIITLPIERFVTPRIERINGYKKAMIDHGLSIINEYVKGLPIHKIQEAVEELLVLKSPPTAIIAGNDLALMEILKVVRKQGIKIPDDIAIICIDDVSYANIFDPALTTIRQPAFGIGEKAANLLLDHIEHKSEFKVAKVYRFEPELIVRSSC